MLAFLYIYLCCALYPVLPSKLTSFLSHLALMGFLLEDKIIYFEIFHFLQFAYIFERERILVTHLASTLIVIDVARYHDGSNSCRSELCERSDQVIVN